MKPAFHRIPAFFQRMRRPVIIISLAGAVMAVLLYSCGGDTQASQQPNSQGQLEKTIPVEILTLAPQSFTENGVYYGKVQGLSEATLVSYGGGLVYEVGVSAGRYVKKGESLCNVDGEKFSTAFESASLQKKIAEDTYRRSEKHLAKGTYSQLQVDQSRQAFLQARQMGLEAEKVRRGALCISPISGIVTQVFVEKNQNLAPGSPTISIATLGHIKIKLAVPENEVAGFAKKGKAMLTIPGTDKKIEGFIHSVSLQVMPGNQSFEVETRFPNKNHSLKPGQTVAVAIFKNPLQNVIVVPSESILNLEKGNAVMVVREGVARQVLVDKGPVSERSTVILKGLTPGDELIIKGHALVSDGIRVEVKNGSSNPDRS